MTSLQVRVFQSHDADRNLLPEERVEPILVRGLQSAPGQASKALISYSPSLTDTPGVYSFDDPERGSGWLRLEGAGPLTLSRVEDLVRLSEIERAIGATDPIPGAELGIAAPMAFHNRSPFVQILTGIGVLVLGSWTASLLASPQAENNPMVTFVAVLATAFLGIGVWTVYMGGRRVRWWMRARKHALSDGGPVPDDLKYWG